MQHPTPTTMQHPTPTWDRHGLAVLDRLECMYLLQHHPTHIGRVAIVDVRGRPAIFLMQYRLVGEDIVLTVAPGHVLDSLLSGVVAAFQIEDLEPSVRKGWSVLARGVPQRAEDSFASTLPGALALRRWASPDAVYLRIPVEEVSGRRL